MPTQKGNILLPLISAVALIAIAAAGYFFYSTSAKASADKQNQQLQNPPTTQVNNYPTATATLTPAPTPQDETTGWKSFSFKENPVTFKYPATLQINYYPTDINGVFDGDRMATYENAVIKNNKTKILGINPNQLGLGFPNAGETKTQPIMVDGKSNNKITAADESYYVLVNYGDKTLFVSCYNEPETCDQILSTFKFTN